MPNPLRILDRITCGIANSIILRAKRVDCRSAISNFNGVLRIAGRGKIIIHPGVRMNSGPGRNPIGGDSQLVLVCRGGTIEIGPNCGLSNCALISDSRILLGENVKVGGGVKIYDTDFHNVDPILRSQEAAGTFHGKSAPVEIKKNAFIGAHSIILKGVTIGENSVVGAGSVVTRDVPDNQIWAGNPAKLIRKL